MSEKLKLYESNIIKLLYTFKAMSSAELCEKLDKSLPLVTKILDQLILDGIVIESGLAPSTGGRRPQMYSLCHDFLYVVAVSMDQLVTRIALIDMGNNYVGEIVTFDLPLADNPEWLSNLSNQILKFIQGQAVEKNKIIGIGIGMPGFIDIAKGLNFSFPNAAGKSITNFISSKIGLPVFIDNDSSLIALAELQFGAAVNEKDAMVINIGWGVGLGMILEGKLYRGDKGFAGEFSHIPVFNNNKLCSCGKNGCLETETSLLVLVSQAIQGIQSGKVTSIKNISSIKPEEANDIIIRAAMDGDQFAVGLLSDIAYKIGRGVAILIHLLNPKLIVLSGRGSIAGKLWQAPIQHAVNEYCIPSLAQNTTVAVSKLGHHAELLGATTLVMENYNKIKVEKIVKNEIIYS